MANKKPKSELKQSPKPVNKRTKKIDKKPSNKTPDSWDILKKNKQSLLVFYKKDKILAELEITPETMNDMMVELNNHIIVDDNIADSWALRKPLQEGLPEFLTIMNDGKILGTLPIDEETGKKLSSQLVKYSQRLTMLQRMNRFRKKKPKSFYFTSFLTIIVLGILLYSVIANILYSFGIILPTF